MRWAIITLTKGALRLGEKIKKLIPGSDLYTLPKWNCSNAKTIDARMPEFVGSIFNHYEILLFIMATGIVVRSIAKHIQHKTIDPGILVMDEKGKFIISLLSGHLGKANEATQLLARRTGATPVITTASDVLETIAVDTLATRLNCEIDSFENAKNITSLIVNDEPVGIMSKIAIKFPLPENIIPVEDENRDDIKGIIFVDNVIRRSFKSMVRLIPKNIIIGMGCRQNMEKEKIIEAIESSLDSLNIHRKAIKHFATADIKKDEKGLQEAAFHYDRELKIISREEIKEVEHLFEGSEFVKNSTGVSSVCEPCAYLSSDKNGTFLMKKTKFKGVTLSVWEEEEKSL